MAARPAVVLEQRELLFPTGLNSRHRRADAANRVLCRNRFLHVGLAFAEGPIEHFGLDRPGETLLTRTHQAQARQPGASESQTRKKFSNTVDRNAVSFTQTRKRFLA